MKILIITDTFPPEKVGSYRMHDLAVNLCKDGFRVTVLCPPPTFPFGNFKRTWKPIDVRFSKGIKVVNLWTWQPQSTELSTLSRLAYYSIMPIIAVIWTVCNSDFDVVITSSGSSPLVWFPGLLAKLLFKKPWIVDVRDLLVDGAISLGFLESESLLTCLLRKFEFNCYLHSDFVLVTSNSARKGVLSYDIPEDRVVLIPNGADTEIFYPRCISKKRQVIYAGNIGYAQDFDCVILAMKEVANHNVHLIIVGEGEVKERLRDLVSANHLDKYVTFLDALERSKLPTLLSESIAGLAPLKKIDTIAGSIPAKVFDYMACAIPFVAFGGSDLRQIAEKSGSGFVVDNDPDALAKTIIYIAENPKLGEEMGQRGLEYCEKYYNRRLMAAKIKSLIFKLYDTRICNGHVANSQTERRLL